MPSRADQLAGPHPPRMEDVARAAGVSLGTVSNVLNQPHKVSDGTRTRVLDAIESLGFSPNRAARSLAAGGRSTMGLVVSDLGNSFFVDIIRGAERAASESSISVLLANADMQGEKQASYLQVFREERMAGILLAPVPGADAALIEASGGTPLVLVNESAIDGACTVGVDNELGGYLAARHLIELGRRTLLFAGDPALAVPVAERLAGVRRAVADTAGVSLELQPTPEIRAEHGRALAQAVLDRPVAERPDGIIAASDLLALGIVQTLSTDGSIRIPDDIAITGYDNNREAWDSLIPITTIAQPGEGIGAEATRLLLDEIRAPATHRHQHAVLQPELVVRASTAGRG